MDKKLQSAEGHFLFNVDILIDARTNPLALQYLLELLNSGDKVTDFKINSGQELGKKIAALLGTAPSVSAQNTASAPAPAQAASQTAPKNQAASQVNHAPKPEAPAPAAAVSDAYGWIRQYIKSNKLVRLRANRQGKQLSLPCRILNFDDATKTISVYHVDEKQVYSFKLNEIDEFQ